MEENPRGLDDGQDIDAIADEMHRICGEERGQVEPAAPPAPPGPTGTEVVQAYKNNQDGDAWLFIRLNAGKWVYDHSLEEWFVFQGHTWERDEVGQAVAEMKGVVDIYLEEADRQKGKAAEDRRRGNGEAAEIKEKLSENIYKRARALQDLPRKKKVLELAASGKDTLGIAGEQWDTDPWVLGCLNGVINLNTGQLRPGRPEDYIKTVCPTEYRGPDEPCPEWDAFLLDVFDGDQELVDYVRRLFGYAITGMRTEHVLPILQGQGRNGKGTILETVKFILGPLAGPIDAEMLLDQFQRRSASGPSPDIMDLRGKRIVWASETDEGRKLNSSRVKWLTGGDSLKGRPPHGAKMIEFTPTHTLFLLTNPLPHAAGDDYALWQRLRLIPFKYSYVDEPVAENEKLADKDLGEKLRAEAPGILAWLVRGCLEWQLQGLGTAAAIKQATTDYRGDEDIIGRFLNDCTIEDPNSSENATDLYRAYREWCQTQGIRYRSSTWFGKAIKKDPRIDYEKSGTMIYIGIRLIQAARKEEKEE